MIPKRHSFQVLLTCTVDLAGAEVAIFQSFAAVIQLVLSHRHLRSV